MRDGWTETALGSVLMLSNKKLGTHKEEPEIFAISKYDGVVLAQDYFDRRIASESLDGYKVIGPGDWVYSTIHIDEGSIAVNHFPFRGVVSPMYTSMIWNSHLHDCRFFEFLLKSDEALIRYQENAQGTVNRRRSLSWNAFSAMTFVVPPLAEQKRIVDVVASVDAYIDTLLQHVGMALTARNAVLHELVSAVGDDWIETTLGELCDVRDGTHDSPKQSEIGFPLVTSKNIRNGKIDMSDVYLISDADFYEINKRSKVDQFDLLISMIGTVGEVCFEPNIPNYAIKNVGLIKTGDELLGRFLLGYLSSGIGQAQIELSTSGSNQKFIGLGKLRSLKIALPPLAEQKRIVEIVSSIDDVIQSTEQAVTDAKNLRSGLLSDLLSGEHEIPASYDSLLGAA